jgi:hypothetical protein
VSRQQNRKREEYKQILGALEVLGIRLKGNKICKADFQKVFGGTYREPEWILMMDYNIRTPFDYVKIVEMEETKLGRAMLPSSYSITRFGHFLNPQGEEVVLDGLIYQYSLAKNPRNVHYAYRLFLDGSTVTKNSGLSGIQVAKQECSEQAKKVVEKELYDLA